MDITGIDKAEILAALYNDSHQQGMGRIDPRGRSNLTVEEARGIIKTNGHYFDYLNGRVMKVDLSGDFLETQLYNRDCGHGAAEAALSKLVAKP